jgi:hypothetical protein
VADSEIAGGQHVGPTELAQQEHVGRPRADATYGGELSPDLVIAHGVQTVQRETAVERPRRQVPQGRHLRRRQADRSKVGVGGLDDRRWRFLVADEGLYAIEDRGRRARGDLLPDDGPTERTERVVGPPCSPVAQVNRLEAVDQRSEHWVGGAEGFGVGRACGVAIVHTATILATPPAPPTTDGHPRDRSAWPARPTGYDRAEAVLTMHIGHGGRRQVGTRDRLLRRPGGR